MVDEENTGLVALRRIRDGADPQIPLGKLIGFRLVEADPGRVGFEFVAERELLNSGGALHGGVHSLVIDQAVGDAVRTLLLDDTPYMTMDLHVSYMRSADVGATLRCTAEVTFLGGRTAKVFSRVCQGEAVLCDCLSTLYIRRPFPMSRDRPGQARLPPRGANTVDEATSSPGSQPPSPPAGPKTSPRLDGPTN